MKIATLAAKSKNRMKKLFIAILAIGILTPAIAQKKNVVSAYNYLRKKDFAEAYKYINMAIEDPTTSNDPKTWKYKGDIMMGMATAEDVEVRTMVESPLLEGAAAWKKAIELDEKEKYTTGIKQMIPVARAQAINGGVEMFNSQKYKEAYQAFYTSAVLTDVLGQVDSLAYFNAGVAADRAEMYDEAIEMYKKCAEINYSNDPSISPSNNYLLLADVYEKKGDTEGYLNILKEGRAKYPKDQNILLKELNYYLSNQKFAEAKENLNAAIANDGKNEILHFALGTVHENLKEGEKAKAAYQKAVEIKPDYFDAQYNLGAYIFNEGVEFFNKANELDFRKESDKIAELEKKAKAKFAEAVPVLEKAHEINPNDSATMASLMQLYTRLGKMEKLKEIKAKMGQ